MSDQMKRRGKQLRALGFFLTLGVIVGRRLFGLWGVFSMALAIYLAAPNILGLRVLTPAQVLEWIVTLPTSLQGSLIVSVVTVAGFTIASNIALDTWRKQKRQEILQESAEELHLFFTEVCRLSSKLREYARLYVELIDKSHPQDEETAKNAQATAAYVLRVTREFEANRARLHDMRLKIFALRSRHYSLLARYVGGLRSFDIASAALEHIDNDLWWPAPVLAENIQQLLGHARAADRSRTVAFQKTVEQNLTMLQSIADGFRAVGINSLFMPNIWVAINSLKLGTVFRPTKDGRNP